MSESGTLNRKGIRFPWFFNSSHSSETRISWHICFRHYGSLSTPMSVPMFRRLCRMPLPSRTHAKIENGGKSESCRQMIPFRRNRGEEFRSGGGWDSGRSWLFVSSHPEPVTADGFSRTPFFGILAGVLAGILKFKKRRTGGSSVFRDESTRPSLESTSRALPKRGSETEGSRPDNRSQTPPRKSLIFYYTCARGSY